MNSCSCGHAELGYQISPERTLVTLRVKREYKGWIAVHRVVLDAHSTLQEVEVHYLELGKVFRVNKLLLEKFGQWAGDYVWLPDSWWRAGESKYKQLSLTEV